MRPVPKFAIAFSAVLIVVAACFTAYEFGRTSRAKANTGVTLNIEAGNWSSNNVPIKLCASSYGLSGIAGHHGPTTMSLKPETPMANRLSFYTDEKRTLTPILGPANWNCATVEGADGTSDISIYPPGEMNPGNAPNGTEKTMGIEETVIPACQGCIADLACPVFLNAESQLGYDGQYCPSYAPTTESVRFLEGNAESGYGVALLSDPAGDPGSVALSGGDYPAIGALLYSSGNGASGSSLACVLPHQDERLCNAILNTFLMAFAKISS